MSAKCKHRQRQGRDFIQTVKPENCLRTAEMSLEGNCNMIDGIINNGGEVEERKTESIMKRIEQHKADAEHHAAPVDGHEPPERGL